MDDCYEHECVKLKPEIKERWLKALRSGDYRQGRQVLRTMGDEPTFCCLGVLCDVLKDDDEVRGRWQVGLHREPGSVDPHQAVPYQEFSTRSGGKDFSVLPGDLVHFILDPETYSYSGEQDWESYQDKLTAMNDNTDVPSDFLAIADWIEENL